MAERKVSLPISDKKVEDLLMWRDPKQSGIIFGSITLAYLILEWSGKSLLSLGAYGLLLAGGGLLGWSYFAQMTKKPGPPIPKFVQDGVSEEEAKKLVVQAVPIVNGFLGTFHSIISGKDLMLGAKCGAALYLIAKVSGWFSFFTLCYLVAALAFGGPKIYELKKDEIDALVAKGLDQVKALTSQGQSIMKKIPSAANTPAKKTN